MPELPEVETVRRGIEGAVLGRRVDAVQINRYDLRVPVQQDFGQQVSGRVIEGLTRRGKYIILEMSGGPRLVLHLGMSGRVRIFPPEMVYTARPHDHVLFTMEGYTRFVFEDPRRFGMLYYTQSTDWRGEAPFSAMGPEPLGRWLGEDLARALKGKKTPIKTALLDQRVVAGLANIYVCEALFACGVHPSRPCGGLSLAECSALVAACKNVLNKAIEAGGSTLRDYQHTDGGLGYFQYQFCVYDKEGAACVSSGCDSQIVRIVQAGRSTYYCPACQK